MVGLPSHFEIKMAGKDVVEGMVEIRQNDGKGFHPFKVGGVMAAGDDVTFGDWRAGSRGSMGHSDPAGLVRFAAPRERCGLMRRSFRDERHWR